MRDLIENELSLQKQLEKECIAMSKYAFGNGLQVPLELANSINSLAIETSALENLDQVNPTISIKQLSQIHNQLSHLILPAKPQTILLFDNEAKSKSIFKFLGPIPLVRYLLAVAILFLLLIIIVSLSSDVTEDFINKNWFEKGMEGWKLLKNLIFLLSASGLGASFAALFQLNKYIVAGTYDPKYIPSYWIRFVLGLIAGIMLAELIPEFSKNSSLYNLGKPVLAMLGGFSASLVYRILTRLLTTVESLLRGDSKELLETQERTARNRANQEISQNRLTLATELIKLKQQIGNNLNPDEMNDMINDMLNKMLPGTTGD